MYHKHKKGTGYPFTIRVPSKKDAAAALAYIRTVTGETEFLDLSPGDIKLTLKEEVDYIHKMTTSPTSMLFIAEKSADSENAGIAGIVSIEGAQSKRRKHIGILGLSVKKEYWSQGIGTALLNTILEWARDNTLLKKIMLHVHEKNKRAIRLYKKAGFVKEGVLRQDRYTGGRYYNTIVMGLFVDKNGEKKD